MEIASSSPNATVEDSNILLVSLPDDALLHILSFIDYNDLLSCCRTCHRLHELSSQDSLWRYQCQAVWHQSERPKDLNWYDLFIEWYKSFGRYVNVYQKIWKAWHQIETYTKEFLPAMYESLSDGCTEVELDTIERKIQLTLPDDLRCAYRLHNGQKFTRYGVMGSMEIHDHSRTEYMLTIQMACDNAQDGKELQDCIPLTFCFESHISQLIALTDKGGYEQYQVFYPSLDSTKPGIAQMDSFITSSSFTEWFATYAQQLKDDIYPRINEQIYKFYREPNCVLETAGIRVEVSSCFMPEHSTVHPPNYFYSYHISMSMAEDADPENSCQLQSRHWIITDEDGVEERVDGPGVVGQFPVMKPGESFSWTSCTTFTTTYGNMRGYFTMKNLATGAQVEVQCPVFHLKCLPYQTSAERTAKVLQKKKNQ